MLLLSARYWLSVGAQPSDTVRRIFFIAGLLPKPPVPQMPKKGKYGLASVLDEEEINLEEDDLEVPSGEPELSAL